MAPNYAFVELSQTTWDQQVGGWRLPLLTQPGVSVQSCFANGRELSKDDTAVNGDTIRWMGKGVRPPSISAKLALAVDFAERQASLESRKVLWQAIAVLGAIFVPIVTLVLSHVLSGGAPPPKDPATPTAADQGDPPHLPTATDATEQCLKRARELKRPYAVTSMTQLVSLELERAGKVVVLHSRIRSIYSLRTLSRISISSAEFREGYLSEYKRSGFHWYGPDHETLHGIGLGFDVSFDAQPGDTKTIVTGADFTYDWPLKGGRKALQETLTLSQNEDTWAYPNTEDVICEATLVVSSGSLKISPATHSAQRLKGLVPLEYKDAVIQPLGTPAEGSPYSMIGARWTLIVPTEYVALHFNLGMHSK